MKKLMEDKKTFTAVVCVCAAFVLLFSGIITAIILSGKKDRVEEKTFLAENEIHGVWIASVSNIDFPSEPGLSADALRSEIDAIVATVKDAGLNTVFFQVRPAADALYKSDIFPVSRYMSENGELTLDALDYMIGKAHGEGIAVHAWINPLRVASGGEVEDLPENSPARLHPDWCVKYADGKLYFDCGIPEVRETVADGIREIVDNYDVDGIVFDDYFYPYPVYGDDGEEAPFDDEKTFADYGTDYDTVGDFRRDAVNSLVKKAYDTVKDADESCLFGVAPFGIWKNGYGGEEGSQTSGAQSYYDIYCDTLAWVAGGYVNYVAPQLYWNENETAAPYSALCDWWAGRTEGTDIALLICHGAYRYEEWNSPEGTMKAQAEYAGQYDSYRGSVFYGYEEICADTHGIRAEIKSIYEKPLTED